MRTEPPGASWFRAVRAVPSLGLVPDEIVKFVHEPAYGEPELAVEYPSRRAVQVPPGSIGLVLATMAIAGGLLVEIPNPTTQAPPPEIWREPSAGLLLVRNADAETFARFVLTRDRVKRKWPRPCKQCGDSFKPERRGLVRCATCRTAKRSA